MNPLIQAAAIIFVWSIVVVETQVKGTVRYLGGGSPVLTAAAFIKSQLATLLEGFVNARLTVIWLTTVTVTQILMLHADARFDRGLLLTSSTNLRNLVAHPLSVLVSSAFFVSSFTSYLTFAAACLFVLAPLENWIGSRRWLVGLGIGHAGTTLAVAAGLWLLKKHGADSDRRVIDVGVSYGVRFLTAVLIFRLQGPARIATIAGLLAIAIAGVVASDDFTDWGHLLATGAGLALAPLLIGSSGGLGEKPAEREAKSIGPQA